MYGMKKEDEERPVYIGKYVKNCHTNIFYLVSRHTFLS